MVTMYNKGDRVVIKAIEELQNSGVNDDDNILNYAGLTTTITSVNTDDDTITLYGIDLTEMKLVDADIKCKF